MTTDPLYKKLMSDESNHANRQLRRSGYASGGAVGKSDAAQDKREIAAGVHAHEKHMHPGQPETKLARGGHVKTPPARTKIEINAGGDQAGKQQALAMGRQQGMRMGAQMAGAPQMGPRPAPAMPPRAMPPGGGAPPIQPSAAGMGVKRGGKVGKK